MLKLSKGENLLVTWFPLAFPWLFTGFPLLSIVFLGFPWLSLAFPDFPWLALALQCPTRVTRKLILVCGRRLLYKGRSDYDPCRHGEPPRALAQQGSFESSYFYGGGVCSMESQGQQRKARGSPEGGPKTMQKQWKARESQGKPGKTMENH